MIQLWDVISHGYWHARRLTFLMGGAYHTLEWVRIAADLLFLAAGVIPMVLAVARLLLAKEDRAPHSAH